MLKSVAVKEAIDLYNRGLISRAAFERELDRSDTSDMPARHSAFWREDTVELRQDRSGVWQPIRQ